MVNKPYSLNLTKQNFETIGFIGNKYSWSNILWKECEVGLNEFEEHKAWEILEGFKEDTKGGHSYFPMLNPASNLSGKLYQFMAGIV